MSAFLFREAALGDHAQIAALRETDASPVVQSRQQRFFVAVRRVEPESVVGYSCWCVEDELHRVDVYVAPGAARQRVGSLLFRAAETAAKVAGALELRVEAPLAAVPFLLAMGFEVAAEKAAARATLKKTL